METKERRSLLKKFQARSGWQYAAMAVLVVNFLNSSARADEPSSPAELRKCPDSEENGRKVMIGRGCYRTLPWLPTVQIEFDQDSPGRITGAKGSTEIYLEKGKIRVTNLLDMGKGASTKVRVLGSEEMVLVQPGLVAQVELLEASEEVACIATKGVMKVSTSYSEEKAYVEGTGEVFPLQRTVIQTGSTTCSFRPRRKNQRGPEVWGFAGLLSLVLLRRLRRRR